MKNSAFTFKALQIIVLFLPLSGWSQTCPDPVFALEGITEDLPGFSSSAIIDFDKDGDRDIVAAFPTEQRLVWMENDGNQKFTEQVIAGGIGNVSAMEVLDFDRDGLIDILTASDDNPGGALTFYRNLGAQVFVETTLAFIDGLSHLSISDIDRDGDRDVVYNAPILNDLGYVRNNGNGTYTNVIIEPNLDEATSAHAVDFDKDADMDIIVASPSNGAIYLYRNNGTQVFQQVVLSNMVTGVSSIFPIDLDVNGHLDILATLPENDYIVALRNYGNSGFDLEYLTDQSAGSSWLTAADINGDALPDILAISPSESVLFWFENAGQFFFNRNVITDELEGVTTLSVGDLDRDGDLDLISGSPIDGNVVWMKNDCIHCPEIDFERQVAASGGNIVPNNGTPADIDQDGDLDILFFSYPSPSAGLYLLENLGDNNYGTPELLVSGSSGDHMDVGDMDNDGDLDIVYTDLGTDCYWVENDGNPPFSQYTISNNWTYDKLAVVDLDQDGNMDIVGSNLLVVNWHRNDGSANFTLQTISTPSIPYEFVFPVDLDQDGDIDVLTASNSAGRIDWIENRGPNLPFLQRNVTVDSGSDVAVAADVDQDGDIDIISVTPDRRSIEFYKNSGNQSFTVSTLVEVITSISSIEVVDIDYDGDLDILSNSGSDVSTWGWLKNDGTTSFELVDISYPNQQVRMIKTADMDLDGDLDVVTFQPTLNLIAIFENYCLTDCGALHLTVSESTIPSGTYHAINTLFSGSAVADDASVVFKAGSSITLYPGFKVTGEASFRALIEDCPESNAFSSPEEVVQKHAFAEITETPNEQIELQVAPNPSRDRATVNYRLDRPGIVNLSIFNLQGIAVQQSLTGSEQEAGGHQLELNLQDLEAGMYLVILQTVNEMHSAKLVVVD